MAQASSAITGGVTVTAATIAPLISWAINGFPKPIPDSLPYLIAAAVVTGAHLVCNLVAERARRQNSPPPQ
jgi:hypothetical protein